MSKYCQVVEGITESVDSELSKVFLYADGQQAHEKMLLIANY